MYCELFLMVIHPSRKIFNSVLLAASVLATVQAESPSAAPNSSTSAGGSGGKGLVGPTQRPPEFFAYVASIQKAIRAAWKYKEENAKLVCKIAFDISPKGEISNLSVVQGSGDLAFDQSVLEAVDAANPLSPPPEKIYDSFKTVRLTFSPITTK